MKVYTLITIISGVRGAIHEHPMAKMKKLNTPKPTIEYLMKFIHQNIIKYLTQLIFIKRKVDRQ